MGHLQSFSSSAKPVHIFEYDVDHKDFIRVPFFFGCCYFRTNNDLLPHNQIQVEFTGTLRPEQKPFINRAISTLNEKRAVTLELRPGFGKTTMVTALTSRIGLVTVILLYDSGLVRQWAETYQRMTTAVTWMVGDENPPPNPDVIICLFTRVLKIDRAVRDAVRFVVIDEAHEFCNTTGTQAILKFTPKYIVACTATFEKKNGMHAIMEAFVGLDRVQGAPLNDIFVTKITTPFKGTREKRNGTLIWSVLNQSIIYNSDRNAFIVTLALILLSAGRKCLFFTNEVEHVELLYASFKVSYIDSCDYIAGKKSNYDDSDILVGNVQKCGTGFDEESYCRNFGGRRIDTIVICASFKDPNLLYQVVGRSFRAQQSYVIHLVDNDSIIEGHWSEVSKWYSNNATSIKTVKMEDVVSPASLNFGM